MPFDTISLSSNAGYGIATPTASSSDCLHLFIDNPRIADLPKSGRFTFRYEKGPMTLREAGPERPAGASADFKLYEIVDAKAAPEQEDDSTPGDVLDKILEEVQAEAEKSGDGE